MHILGCSNFQKNSYMFESSTNIWNWLPLKRSNKHYENWHTRHIQLWREALADEYRSINSVQVSTFGFNLVSFVSIQRTYAGSIFHLSLALLESQFFGSGKKFICWLRWSKMGEPVQKLRCVVKMLGVSCKTNISRGILLFPIFFSPRTDEGCLVYYACCKEEHSPLSICTDSGLQWGQAVLVGVLLS